MIVDLEKPGCPDCGVATTHQVDMMVTRHCHRCRAAFNAARTIHGEGEKRFCAPCEVYISDGQWPRHENGRMHRLHVSFVTGEGVLA